MEWQPYYLILGVSSLLSNLSIMGFNGSKFTVEKYRYDTQSQN